jgi:NAD(P)-dependent dehydrogenase (short-subunit alcohol dehydrogenase family)
MQRRVQPMGLTMFSSFPAGGQAVVIGASGGIGSAVADAADASGRFALVSRFSRAECDVTREDTIAAVAAIVQQSGLPLRMVLVASGFLHGETGAPEKGLRQLDPAFMAQNFAVNAIGPALVMKHFLPLLARDGKAVFAVISAKVASLGDNALGGWHSYRASKAALNMFAKNGAIEMARTRPELVVASLHPGTVDTNLSAPFSKAGLDVRAPSIAARDIITVIDGLTPSQSGGFFNHKGEALPW